MALHMNLLLMEKSLHASASTHVMEILSPYKSALAHN